MYHLAFGISLILAAHCFWDLANQKTFDESLYIVGAGKYKRDYAIKESNAQFCNISKITVPDRFTGDINNYEGEIAVLILGAHLKYSPHIAPICIDWKEMADKAIRNGTNGRVVGWGIDKTDLPSKELRHADVLATSYIDCKAIAGELESAITNDKFCVFNEQDEVVCKGDSCGGFTVKKYLGNRNVYLLWGIVSSGVPKSHKCKEYNFVSHTHIQYYEKLIRDIELNNRET